MVQQYLRIIKKKLYLEAKNRRTFGLIIFLLIIFYILQNHSKLNLINEETTQNDSISMRRFKMKLLFLYEKELSRIEEDLFQPIFHNHYLTLKLNLTSMGKNFLNYFKNNSNEKIQCLKVTCLIKSKYKKDFHPVCHFHLNFLMQIFDLKKAHLNLLSANSSCLSSLKNTSDIISLDIDQMFLVDDKFRFTYQWSNFNQAKLFSWSQWPLTMTCLNLALKNLSENKNQFTQLQLNSFQCPSVDTLIHSTSQELFYREQEAVSYWLDLQNDVSIYKNFSVNKTKSIKIRRLIPFEIAKNSEICSTKFQKWILNYHKWHEKISLVISKRSITFEEQLQRIIELNVRFLIYEKPYTGIADRIIHLITTYFIAILTNRLLIFDQNWPEFIDIIQSSLNYQPEFIIPWFSQMDTIIKKLSLNIQKNLTKKDYSFSLDRYNQDYDYEKHCPERIVIFKAHTGGVIHMITSNSSIYRKFLTIDLEMNSDNIFGCLYHSLFTYRLSQLIKRVPLTSSNNQLGHSSQQILQTILSPKFFPIGIQIRAGDQEFIGSGFDVDESRTLNKFQTYFICSQQIINTNKTVFHKTNQIPISFLLSDGRHIRQAALKRWKFPFECFQSLGNKCQLNSSNLNILANSDPVFHTSFTANGILAFQLGMFDNFLFSLCEQHIITKHSGFGRLAAFASLKLRDIYSFQPDQPPLCENQSLPLAISGHQWSGI